MDTILADLSVSMSEFKKNPAAVLRHANRRTVAVLNHNKPAMYLVDPKVYEAMLEAVADADILTLAAKRRSQKSKAVEVSLGDL